jgi:hypothetical protein
MSLLTPQDQLTVKTRVDEVLYELMPLRPWMPLLRMLSYTCTVDYSENVDSVNIRVTDDQLLILHVNPEFVLHLGSTTYRDELLFTFYRAALYLLRSCLVTGFVTNRPDPLYCVAEELWINNYIGRLSFLKKPKRSDSVTTQSEVFGNDPQEAYDSVVSALRAKAISDVPSYDEFYTSERTVYQWVSQVDKLQFQVPVPPSPIVSVSPEFVPQRALPALVTQAGEGRTSARNELARLLRASIGDKLQEMIFADLGAHQVVSQKVTVLQSNTEAIRLLSQKARVSFSDLVIDPTEYARRLAPEHPLHKVAALDIYLALATTPLSELEHHQEACGELLRMLSFCWRFEVLKTVGSKWPFWSVTQLKAFPQGISA